VTSIALLPYLVDVTDAILKHLLPDAIQVLGPARDVLVLDAALLEARLDRLNSRFERCGVLAGADHVSHSTVLGRIQHGECKVLELGLQFIREGGNKKRLNQVNIQAGRGEIAAEKVGYLL